MLIRNKNGQGMLEYIIVVSLVGIAAVGIMKVVGQNISAQFSRVANQIQGKQNNKVMMKKVESKHYKMKGLDDFDEGNEE